MIASVQALEKVGLGDRRDHFPSQLSGGQQQRVAIARALVSRPEVVLADEPTGNLDTRTSIEIMGLFQELNDSGITIVMVTHELDIAAYCKRIVVMRDGQVISDTVNENRRVARDRNRRARSSGRKGQTRLNPMFTFIQIRIHPSLADSADRFARACAATKCVPCLPLWASSSAWLPSWPWWRWATALRRESPARSRHWAKIC